MHAFANWWCRVADRVSPSVQQAVVITLAMAPHALKLALPVREMFSGFIPDDAFYYYRTALNIRAGLGPTFDGINPTTGFHPLWMMQCVLCAFVTQNPQHYLALVLGLNLAWVAVLSIAVTRLTWRSLGPGWTAVLLLMMHATYRSSTAYFSGLETPCALVCLLAVANAMTRAPLQHAARSVRFGLWVALAFLARTDAVLLAPVLLVAAWVEWRAGRASARTIVVTCIPPLVLGGAYLVWNVHTCGYAVPISGLVKSLSDTGYHTVPALLRGLGDTFGGVWGTRVVAPNFVAPLLGVVAAAGAIHTYRTAEMRRALMWTLPVFAFGVIAAIWYAATYGKAVRTWHLAPTFLAAQILCVIGLRGAWTMCGSRRFMRRACAGFVGLLCLDAAAQVPGAVIRFRQVNYHFMAPVYYQDEVTRWMRGHLPPGTRVGVWDAGYLGYFSGARVTNLDGLINGRRLYESLRASRDGVWDYAGHEGVAYISNYYFGDPVPPRSALGPRLHLVYHVGRQPVTYAGQSTYVDWYVWRLDPEEPPALAR